MSEAPIFGVCGAVLFALGVFGLAAGSSLLRRLLGFNLAGSGLFLLLGSLGARAPDAPTDPVPQALIITGIVVALSATALAVALMASLARLEPRPDEKRAEEAQQ